MDGRRRQWVTWDVFFNTGTFGSALRDEFGVVGCFMFNSFICACKKNSVQGRISYTSDAEALAVLGLPGLRLVNEDGKEFTLDEFWAFLGRKRQARRTNRGRIVDVVSTRWEDWQKPPGKRQEQEGNTGSIATAHHGNSSYSPGEHPDNAQGTGDQQKERRRSKTKITGQLETKTTPENDPYHDVDVDPEDDVDGDPDVDVDAPPLNDDAIRAAMAEAARQREAKASQSKGEGEKLRGLMQRLEAVCVGDHRPTVRTESITVIGVCMQAVDLSIIESAVTELERGKPPTMPRVLFAVVRRHCQQRGLPAPMLALPFQEGRAS